MRMLIHLGCCGLARWSWAGCSIAGVLAATSGGHIQIYCQGQRDPTGFLRSVAQFDIVSALYSFFSGFGSAFSRISDRGGISHG